MDLDTAIQIAATAHENQFDKSGQPYVLHPLRVMMRLFVDTDDAELAGVAVLHDVLEDTSYSLADLEKSGLTDRQAETLLALTRDKEFETYAEYIDRVIESGLDAIRVKLYDIHDNLRAGGIASHRKRYREARGRLLEALGDS